MSWQRAPLTTGRLLAQQPSCPKLLPVRRTQLRREQCGKSVLKTPRLMAKRRTPDAPPSEPTVRASVAELDTTEKMKWIGGSVQWRTRSASSLRASPEDLNIAIEKAKAEGKKLAKREWQREQKALAETEREEVAHTADVAGSRSSPSFPGQPPSSNARGLSDLQRNERRTLSALSNHASEKEAED